MPRWVRCLFAFFLAVWPLTAAAQSSTTGAIHGVVTDIETDDGAVGCVVTVRSPALLGTRSAITDERGSYKIVDLPPGTYSVMFEYGGPPVPRLNVKVGVGRATGVFQKMGLSTELIRIVAPPPEIDTTDGKRQTRVGRDELTHLPMPGLTYESATTIAPGTSNDGYGVAVSGSSSLESRYFVDGVDTTGIQFGTVGSPVMNDFIEEIEVITGGYNAEYGRATGGIVNVVTKSGSNTLRGSAFAYLTPGALVARRERAPTQASSIDAQRDLAYQADVGVDLGGPIIKDKAWFYVGVAPSFTRNDTTRTIKRRTDCRQVEANGQLSRDCLRDPLGGGGYADGLPDVDPETGFLLTEDVESQTYGSRGTAVSMLGKVNVALTPEHQGQLSVMAQPQSGLDRGAYGLPGTTARDYTGNTTDVAMRWTSKFDDNKTDVEATVGWHRSVFESDAGDETLNNQPLEILRFGSLGVLGALGGESPTTIAGCTDGGADDPYPYIANCPDDGVGYRVGGPGTITRDAEDRRSIRLAVTRRQRAFGHHELKAGIDAENNVLSRARLLSGGAFLDNLLDRNMIEATRWVQLAPMGTTDARFDNTCRDGDLAAYACDYLAGIPGAPGTDVTGNTFNWATYLRDSWQVKPNLTINVGLRYEEQRLRYAESLQGTVDALTGRDLGTDAMVLTGMVAPRLGAVYDWTREGRAKAFVFWGRFFESIPLQINDRSFGGEVMYHQIFRAAQCGSPDDNGLISGTGCISDEDMVPELGEYLFGSSGVLVAPDIKAQYMDEILAGVEMELAEDTKLGVAFQHRSLGRVIEDVSTDGARTYVIANPGEWSTDAETTLLEQIADTSDPDELMRLENELAMYRGIRAFDKPRRDYDALQMTLSRRLARGLFVQASYTYSRTRGNFPGLISYDNGQVDPNISSQYDLIELLANRDGPLPQDRPHYVKLDSYYTFELARSQLTLGARLRAMSGIPIDVLGPHSRYGGDESFVLPRGALSRTDFEHGIDVHLGWGRHLTKGVALELFADLFNIYNRQGTFEVDETYVLDIPNNNVNPIVGGSYDDLIWAKAVNEQGAETASPIIRNQNFGNPSAHYAPFSARLGARLTF